MAKTKRKRRRKHRGTQGGSVARTAKGRPRNRAEAKARARKQRSERGQRGQRGLRPPTWPGAFGKGALASVLFFALFAGLFHRPLGASAGLALFTLAFYVPFTYYLDGFFYRRRIRQQQQGGS